MSPGITFVSPGFTVVVPVAPLVRNILHLRTWEQRRFCAGGAVSATLLCSRESCTQSTYSPAAPSNAAATLPPGAKALSRSDTDSTGGQEQAKSLEQQLASLRFGYEDPESLLDGEACPEDRLFEVAIAGRPKLNGTSEVLGKVALERNCDICPIRYLCERGHIVTAYRDSPACRGCPLCQFEQTTPACNKSRAKLSLASLSDIARERNGLCLASLYVSSRTPVPWRCQNGHTWLASVDNVKGKHSWCPECARARKKLSIADMRVMAESRGGKCLSAEYVSGLKKLRWQCAKGHEFLMAPNNIRREPTSARKPSWCPVCKRSCARQVQSQGVLWQKRATRATKGDTMSRPGLRRDKTQVACIRCPTAAAVRS